MFWTKQSLLCKKADFISPYDSFALDAHIDTAWHHFKMTVHITCLSD